MENVGPGVWKTQPWAGGKHRVENTGSGDHRWKTQGAENTEADGKHGVWWKTWGMVENCEIINKNKQGWLNSMGQIILSKISDNTAFLLQDVTWVILCNTLKKECCAVQNIGKYNPILFNQPCLYIFLYHST